ncbi:MAG: hypothetical protein P4L03_08330 [Terracidiphilus sp.]|nr:hypothetical protein [Terracidiphilus sp.]
MAVKKSSTTRATTKRTTTRAASKTQRKTKTTEAAEQAGTAEMVEGEGLDMLRNAAADELRKNGKRIAANLRRKSEAGDPQSTKLLMTIAEKPKKTKPQTEASVAVEIGSDDTWVAPVEGSKATGHDEEDPALDKG